MNPEYYQTVPRKKDKTDILKHNPYLSRYILDTRLISLKSLTSMLKTYDMVVFKPNIGGGGHYVGFMEQKENGLIHMRYSTGNLIFKDISTVYKFIINLTTEKRFILQKGVSLLSFKGRPIDIRIEMQKAYESWDLTGIVAKIASKDKMVTNRHSGGHGIPLKKLIPYFKLSEAEYNEIKGKLFAIGFLSARDLNKKYIGLRELGFDIAIDKNLDLYILEVNTKPQFGIFMQL